MSDEAILRIKELRALIKEHNIAYYEKDAPVISDAQWDTLMRELRDLETQFPDNELTDSPTETIGGAPNKIFAPVKHSVPMMSLDNAFDIKAPGFDSGGEFEKYSPQNKEVSLWLLARFLIFLKYSLAFCSL